MTPQSFTFKLTVPREPQMAAIVADVAGHAVGYAEMDAATGADFVARVSAAAAVALATPGQVAVQVVVTGDAATVTFAIDQVPVSASRSS